MNEPQKIIVKKWRWDRIFMVLIIFLLIILVLVWNIDDSINNKTDSEDKIKNSSSIETKCVQNPELPECFPNPCYEDDC